MRTCFSWIQPHPHGAVPRHLINMVNSFFCSFTNYFENQLLPIDLIIVRNHGHDEKDDWDINKILVRQGGAHIKVEIQFNSEFQSLTSSPTRSTGSPRLQINVQETYDIGFGRSTYTQKENEINFPMESVPRPNKIGFHQNSRKFSISRVPLVQELSILKMMPKSHTTSNWGVLGLLGKVRRYPLQ
jgi:hypothetical protein